MPLRIAAFAHLGEIEIVAIGAPNRTEGNAWRLKTVVRRRESPTLQSVMLPIGDLPLLSVGRVFGDGVRNDLAWTGVIADVVVPDVSDCEEIGSNEVPSALLDPLFPRRAARGDPQSVLVYTAGARRLYVPAIELIRALHLPCPTLANAILRPGALMELYEPLKPGSFEKLELNFSTSLPVGLLRGRRAVRFVERFAWIAAHPDGRKSWDSVARLTHACGRMRVAPPPLRASNWRVRMIEAGDAALVLEIISVTGKEQVADAIDYSHPRLIRKIRLVPGGGSKPSGSKTGRERESAGGISGAEPLGEDEDDGDGEERLIIETLGAKRRRDPRTVDIGRDGNEFDRVIPIRDIRIETPAKTGERSAAIGDPQDGARGGSGCASADPDGGEPSGAGGRAEAGSTPAKTRRRKVSVAEPEAGATLDPLEFTLLERMITDYVGSLGPLTETLRRVDATLPDVRIATSLTPLPDGRAISRVDDARIDRRPALVAVLWPADRGPTVLIDVDHSGGVAIAMLALRYEGDMMLHVIEEDVKAMLTALAANGFWVVETLQAREGAGAVAVDRLVKVLRRRQGAKAEDYLEHWARVLIERLGLGGYVRRQAQAGPPPSSTF